jgi:hypothetical protein
MTRGNSCQIHNGVRVMLKLIDLKTPEMSTELFSVAWLPNYMKRTFALVADDQCMYIPLT